VICLSIFKQNNLSIFNLLIIRKFIFIIVFNIFILIFNKIFFLSKKRKNIFYFSNFLKNFFLNSNKEFFSKEFSSLYILNLVNKTFKKNLIIILKMLIKKFLKEKKKKKMNFKKKKKKKIKLKKKLKKEKKKFNIKFKNKNIKIYCTDKIRLFYI
jgi:hypothetical protein